MKIAILSRNPDLYSTSRLREEAEKKEHECRVIDTLKCSIDITTANPAIWYKGEKLERQDAIIRRVDYRLGHRCHSSVRNDGYLLSGGFDSFGSLAFKITSAPAASSQRTRYARNRVCARRSQHPSAD